MWICRVPVLFNRIPKDVTAKCGLHPSEKSDGFDTVLIRRAKPLWIKALLWSHKTSASDNNAQQGNNKTTTLLPVCLVSALTTSCSRANLFLQGQSSPSLLLLNQTQYGPCFSEVWSIKTVQRGNSTRGYASCCWRSARVGTAADWLSTAILFWRRGQAPDVTVTQWSSVNK